MLGFFSGVVLAVWYRNEGPQKPVYEWMEEEESRISKEIVADLTTAILPAKN